MNGNARLFSGLSVLRAVMVRLGPGMPNAEEFDDSVVKHIVYPDWFLVQRGFS